MEVVARMKGVTKSELIRRALSEYLRRYFEESGRTPAIRIRRVVLT